MTHGHTHVTEHRRVGQVTLQTAHRQLSCQELQDGIGNAEVTLRILIVDGVHLMRHRTGAHLTSLDFLLEVIHGDIHPEVTVQVDDNRIYTAHGIKDGAKPVIIGDLCRELLTLQTKFLTHEAVTELTPVVLGISHMMSIEVTRSATKLSGYWCLFQRTQLLFQTIYIYHHLLTQTRW